MSEYWKSTPSYWCKFCSQYVRDTPIERKNHESSAKHQNNIQRSLRELHKGKEREERDKQRAKDEVARLNGLVGGQSASAAGGAGGTTGGGGGRGALSTSKDVSSRRGAAPAPASVVGQAATAQQRKAQAEQLAKLGVELPEELKREITGVGSYEVVREQEVFEIGRESGGGGGDVVVVDRSLAEILAESRRGEGGVMKEGEEGEEEKIQGGRKRKAGGLDEDEDGEGEGERDEDEESAPKMRKTWGSKVKTYPGQADNVDVGDLDALLGGVKKKEKVKTKMEDSGEEVKEEDDTQEVALNAVPEIGSAAAAMGDGVKQEDGAAAAAAPAVVFKKRKGKK